MIKDPIVEEIHLVRAQLLSHYNNDLHAFCEAIRRSHDATDRVLVTRLPRQPQQGGATQKSQAVR